MDRDQDSSGDYGYDLVHEEAAGSGRRDDRSDRARRPDQEHTSPAPSRRAVDPGDDLAYDEAHDF